ncbi:MAG: hypothetical protein ACD_5C00088G0001 [uncultured bacterium]|nr:MAG: hypothetical protein ACD_5C00088G0001 [uncultured bacterium]
MQVNRLPDGSLSLVSSAPTFQDAKKHQTVHVSYPVKIVCVGDQAFRATLDDHYTFKIPQEFWQAIISECQEKLKDVKRDERFFEQHQDGELTFYYVPLLQEREIRALFSLMLTRLSWKNPQINFDALAHAIWLNFQDHPKILSQITKDFDRYPALQGITDILRMNSASRKGRSWWSAILAPKTAAGSAQEVKPPPPAPLAPKQ